MQQKRPSLLSEVDVSLLWLGFEVFQFLQDVCEVILQVPLQCDYVLLLHPEKFISLGHWNWEDCVTRKNLEDPNKCVLCLDHCPKLKTINMIDYLWKCQSISNIICPLEEPSQLAGQSQDWDGNGGNICILPGKSLTQCNNLTSDVQEETTAIQFFRLQQEKIVIVQAYKGQCFNG